MLPQRLKELRTEAGLTQKEIAEKIHVGQNSYSNWENGNRKPTAEITSKLADFFKVPIDYLLGNSEIRNPYEKSEFESLFDQLDDEQKEKAIRFLDNLIKEK
ncbi:TPA: helix-turn-helix domain-containing protein [Streptococcus suis]